MNNSDLIVDIVKLKDEYFAIKKSNELYDIISAYEEVQEDIKQHKVNVPSIVQDYIEKRIHDLTVERNKIFEEDVNPEIEELINKLLDLMGLE